MPVDTPLHHRPYENAPADRVPGYEQPFVPPHSHVRWFEDVASSTTAMSKTVADAADLTEYLISSKISPMTPFSSETEWRSLSRSSNASEVASGVSAAFDELQHSNDLRIKLLERKYIRSDLSNDDAARLRLLTERVRRLDPAFDTNALVALESIASTLEESRAVRQRILAELDD
jgi:hypothetical protein